MPRNRKKKAKHTLPVVEVNVVSLMDVLTTLLFFLLMIASINKLSAVPGKALPPGASSETDPKPTFALQVILKDKRSGYIYLGPVQKLPRVKGESFDRYLKTKFKGSEKQGYFRIVKAGNYKSLLRKMQSILIRIKKTFPQETKAVAAFADKVPYQKMVDAVTSFRQLPKNRGGVTVTNLVGNTYTTTNLFPQLIVTEWQDIGRGTASGG